MEFHISSFMFLFVLLDFYFIFQIIICCLVVIYFCQIWFFCWFEIWFEKKNYLYIAIHAQVSAFICNMVRIGFGVQFRHCNGQHSYIEILRINHLWNALDWIIKCLVCYPIFRITKMGPHKAMWQASFFTLID